MKWVHQILCTCSVLFFTLLPSFVLAGVSNLSVTLRGKKYTIDTECTTVKDLETQMKEVAGGATGRLLFGGKRLNSEDVLSDVGVKDGSSLNMVPGASKKSSTSSSASTKKMKTEAKEVSASGESSTSAPGGMPNFEELMKAMPGAGAGGDGKMPNLDESMDMMSNMMNSPLFQEFMNDPEKLEQSRQMILQNPMMKSMLAGMPGMAEILNDKDAWREAMMAASKLYQDMDPEDLKKAMMGQMPPGAFGGPGADGANPSALDELSEGDD